ncbi:MAG: rhodanese-like domain-containing protein [Lutibacter sp.]|nr:rhodanese-like domain-containing protein [Lutibacter sp.]MDT8417314.1 rhodanese-like domain-containing protein [Lutibacter sp.]
METPENCITLDILKQKLKNKNEIIIIDVRSNEEYIEKHIPIAINIPLDKLENEVKKFDKNKFYITACGKGGNRSASGAEKLNNMKFNALWLCGGTFGWFD